METVTNNRQVQAAKIPLNPYQLKLVEQFLSQHPHIKQWSANTLKAHRTSLMYHIGERGISKEFKDWLFDSGMMLVRKERKWYLHFFDGVESSKFMLMHM